MSKILTLVLFLSLCGSITDVYGGPFSLERPRIIIDRQTITIIRDNKDKYLSSEYTAIKRYSVWRQNSYAPEQNAASGYHTTVVIPLSLLAIVERDPVLLNYMKRFGMAMAEVPPTNMIDTELRERLMSLSIMYDWLHAEFTSDERLLLAAAIVDYIEAVEPLFLSKDKVNYLTGHSRFASISALYGLAAVWEDWSGEEKNVLFGALTKQWKSGYQPLQHFVGKDGAYPVGWQYSTQLSLWPYLIWEKTDVDGLNVVPDLQNERILFYLYGVRGDRTFPRVGDVNNANLGQWLCLPVAFAAARYSNSIAEWFYREYLDTHWDPYNFWRLIFRNPSVEAISPVEAGLPKSRKFDHSGIVISRDSWNQDATLVLFKSTPFRSITHHHRDQNHVEISYKGSLLIDSGVYDQYASAHWKNYYTKSIAHNTLLIRQPSSNYPDIEVTAVNDGGQVYPRTNVAPAGLEPQSIADVEAEKYRLAGIIYYKADDHFSSMKGDATLAYDPAIVESYVRSVVVVYRPSGRHRPVVVLKDEISLKDDGIPVILFHSNTRASIEDRYFAIQNNNGGFLHGELLGSDATIEQRGGPGDEWSVNGVSHLPLNSPAEGMDNGSWRVEVSGDSAKKKWKFITVLAIDDVLEMDGRPQAVYRKEDTRELVEIGETSILWHNDGTIDVRGELPSAPVLRLAH